MWDLSGPGIEPMSSALAGRFFTTEPQEKPGPLLLLTIPLMLCSAVLGRSVVSDSAIPWIVAHQAPLSMGFFGARILEWDAIFLLQGIFPTQGLNQCLLNHKQII